MADQEIIIAGGFGEAGLPVPKPEDATEKPEAKSKPKPEGDK